MVPWPDGNGAVLPNDFQQAGTALTQPKVLDSRLGAKICSSILDFYVEDPAFMEIAERGKTERICAFGEHGDFSPLTSAALCNNRGRFHYKTHLQENRMLFGEDSFTLSKPTVVPVPAVGP